MDAAQAAQDLLAAAVAALTTDDTEPPERQFVTVGEVVDVCDQLVVSFFQAAAGRPAAGGVVDLKNAPTQSVGFTFEVRLTMCWPAEENPAVDVITARALEVIAAGELLVRGIRRAILRDDEAQLFADCSSKSLGPLATAGPEGGVVVLSLAVAVQD